MSAPKYIDIWMLFSIIIPVLEILLHTVEDHYIRLEAAEGGTAERQPTRKQQQQLLTLHTKTIKILPLGPEQEDEDEEEGRKLTQWVLKRIEVSAGQADRCQYLSLKVHRQRGHSDHHGCLHLCLLVHWDLQIQQS